MKVVRTDANARRRDVSRRELEARAYRAVVPVSESALSAAIQDSPIETLDNQATPNQLGEIPATDPGEGMPRKQRFHQDAADADNGDFERVPIMEQPTEQLAVAFTRRVQAVRSRWRLGTHDDVHGVITNHVVRRSEDEALNLVINGSPERMKGSPSVHIEERLVLFFDRQPCKVNDRRAALRSPRQRLVVTNVTENELFGIAQVVRPDAVEEPQGASVPQAVSQRAADPPRRSSDEDPLVAQHLPTLLLLR